MPPHPQEGGKPDVAKRDKGKYAVSERDNRVNLHSLRPINSAKLRKAGRKFLTFKTMTPSSHAFSLVLHHGGRGMVVAFLDL
jgi:hypothetical protein